MYIVNAAKIWEGGVLHKHNLELPFNWEHFIHMLCASTFCPSVLFYRPRASNYDFPYTNTRVHVYWWQWMQWVVDVTWLSLDLTGKHYGKCLLEDLHCKTTRLLYYIMGLPAQADQRTHNHYYNGWLQQSQEAKTVGVWCSISISQQKQLHYLAFCTCTSKAQTCVWNKSLIMTKWISVWWVFCDPSIL